MPKRPKLMTCYIHSLCISENHTVFQPEYTNYKVRSSAVVNDATKNNLEAHQTYQTEISLVWLSGKTRRVTEFTVNTKCNNLNICLLRAYNQHLFSIYDHVTTFYNSVNKLGAMSVVI